MHPTKNETVRIQKHIAGAEAWIAQRDVRHLSPLQRERRLQLRHHLAEYRSKGVFPVNPDFSEPTPYFLDASGVPCAMAHLILSTGHEAWVEHVARTNNHARIHDLASDPTLLAWLETHGMTVEEAARVQPAYAPVDRSPAYYICNDVSSIERTNAIGAMIRDGSIPVEVALVRVVSERNQESEIQVKVEKTFGDSALNAGTVMILDYPTPTVREVGAVFLALVYPVSKEMADASPLKNAQTIISLREGRVQGVITAIPTLENGDVGCAFFPSELSTPPENMLEALKSHSSQECNASLAKANSQWSKESVKENSDRVIGAAKSQPICSYVYKKALVTSMETTGSGCNASGGSQSIDALPMLSTLLVGVVMFKRLAGRRLFRWVG